jgi:hypothetical protein
MSDWVIVRNLMPCAIGGRQLPMQDAILVKDCYTAIDAVEKLSKKQTIGRDCIRIEIIEVTEEVL